MSWVHDSFRTHLATFTCALIALIAGTPHVAFAQAKPSIASHPQNQSVIVGSHAMFTVNSTGQSPLVYRWYFAGAQLSNDARISGAATNSLGISNVFGSDAGNYWVTVSNRHGMITSDVATLTLLFPPTIGMQPQNQTVAVGSNATFNVDASGTGPLFYQWRKNGAPVSGATSSSLVLSNVQFATAENYSVVVTNSYGSVTSAVATLEAGIRLPGLKGASAAWADYDNDGKTDVILTGVLANGTRFARLYRNIGEMLFKENPASLPQVALASAAWGDYDNDGDLDFVISGETFNGSLNAVTAVYRNDGNGVFTNINAGIQLQSNADVRWLDFDNDGRLDIFLALFGDFWRNQGDGTFAKFTSVAGAYPGRADVGDLDNDGDQDLTLIAPLQNNGMPPSLVRNNGSSGMSRSHFGFGTYSYSCNFVDYDTDGDLDIAIGNHLDQKSIQFFKNDGQGNLTLTDVNIRSFQALASSWGDYDNDGKPDCLTMEHGTEQDLIEVLRDFGTNWNHILWFSGVWDGAASFVDIDSDGDLDVFYTGRFSSTMTFTQSGFLMNNIAATNTPPTAPGGLTHEVTKGNTVALRWNPASDAQTQTPGLNYNLRVGTTPGGVEIMSPASDLTSGRRQIPARGNAGPTNFWVLRDLPIGTYYWSVQAIDPTFAGSPFTLVEDSFSITATPPKIVSQPLSQSVVLDSNAFLSVTATGTSPLFYQWRKGGVNLVDGGNISGATTSTLTISSVVSNDAGAYQLFISNAFDTVTSAAANLTVLFPPTITAQPTNQTALIGANLNLLAAATGTGPLSFRWQRDGTNLLNGGRITGATNATLQIANAQTNDSGNYTLVVSNIAGSVTSAVASINVVPLIITTQPVSRSVPAGTNVGLTVAASGVAPITYQWRFNQSDLLAKTNASLSLTNVQAPTAGDYDVIVSNPYSTLTSSIATLVVEQAPPTITLQATSRVASMGQTVTFSVAAKGSEPMTCQWQFNGTDLSGANGFALVLDSVNSSVAGTYRAVISNNVGIVFSTNVTLVVSPVVAWGGFNTQLSGNNAIPATVTNVMAITAGKPTDAGSPSYALRADGTLITWGGFTPIPSGTTNVVAISSGGPSTRAGENNLALLDDGTVVHWNALGKQSLPSAVTNGNNVAVAAGGLHQLVLRDDGKVFAWGSNTVGELNVPPGATNIIAIVAGARHSLALRADGKVFGWGSDTSGQSGALSNAVNVAAISAGGNQSLALLYDGTVTGRIVTNTPSAAIFYGSPAGNTSNKIAIAAGVYHSLGLNADGTINGWGATNSNRLNIPAFATNALAISAGINHNLALVHDPFAAPIPPRIARPPVSRTITAGQSAVFNALAVGGLPLSYQWLRNGAPVFGQTRASLTFSNALPGDAGNYQLVAINDFSSVTSAVAVVTVVPPAPILDTPAWNGLSADFNFGTISGAVYTVQFKTNLGDSSWMELFQQTGTGAPIFVSDTNQPNANRFFRVKVQ